MTAAPEPDPILVVEDEETIARFVAEALKDEGHAVITEGTLRDGLRAAATRRPQLLIVDLGLPDGDGVDLISAVRGFSAAPVIVLSARTDERQKIQALDMGADDYLVKPFGMRELLARVRAQLRRRLVKSESAATSRVQFDDVTVDLGARIVTKGGNEVHLTKLEYRLLEVLIESRGKVLTQRQLLTHVWGPQYIDRPHYLRIYMSRLRAKLEHDPAHPKWLLTETGVGCRLAL